MQGGNLGHPLHLEGLEDWVNWARPKKLSDFDIIEKLGEGANGTVFKVREIRSCEILVMKQIKVHKTDPGDLEDKVTECQMMSQLRHANVNKYKSHFVANDGQLLCILFEFSDRGDL